MLISLDMSSDIPIYVQLRNQIVTGIGKGELKAGESLPSVRQMARDAGINNMTVNKTYQILKDLLRLTGGKAPLCARCRKQRAGSGRSWRQNWNFCPRRPA